MRVRLVRGRRRGGARDPAGGPAARQLPPGRGARRPASRWPATARRTCWCSASRSPVPQLGPTALDALRAHGGEVGRGPRRPARGAWRDAFLRAPYLRDTLRGDGRAGGDVRDRDHVGAAAGLRRDASRARVREALGPEGSVTCRLTHAYPDGAAPYFTVLAPVARGERDRALGRRSRRPPRSAVLAGGGTITHHHAVGRDHRPWYDASGRSRSPPRCGPPRRRSTRAACSTPGYSSTRDEQRQRQEHGSGLQGQGGPRQDLPVGRQGHRGPHGLLRHRADGLGRGRRHLRARRSSATPRWRPG